MTSPRDASLTGTSNPAHFTPVDGDSSRPRRSILVIFGTRPEAVKLCPLIGELRRAAARVPVDPVICVTGQHREMLDQVLQAFEIRPDYDLGIMQPGQTLASLTARLMAALEPVFAQVRPALAIVQGDTTTALCGALSAFYAAVPVAHVEAGLRTHDPQAPFPEEMNRVLASRLASLHFAATPWAAANLTAEGIPSSRVTVTGNTGIDALLYVRDALESGRFNASSPPPRLPLPAGKKIIVVTAHRRESFGAGFEQICEAIGQLAERPDVHVVWPVHLNPEVRRTVFGRLSLCPHIDFLDPLPYVSFVDLMRRAYLLITDSGGIQEEGPSLGKPILVLREKTERPEAVAAGTAKLAGTSTEKIVREASRLLDDSAEYQRMARLENPYGDGRASARIVQRIEEFLEARSAVPAAASAAAVR
jgi:UDP-N-acetylglucosamine 2-epimerase (non-hydrolysing)